jgi:cytochrome c biogenesis protein CcmG/thiol:disulfide interchange protein DsbE
MPGRVENRHIHRIGSGVQSCVTTSPSSPIGPAPPPTLDPQPIPASPSAAAATPPLIQRLRAARAVLWALVLVMAVAWLFEAGGLDSIMSMFQTTPPPPSTADIGQAALPLKLPLAGGGGDLDLSQYRGKVVALNFWATWCVPCRSEMPVFEQAQQQYRDRGLVVLGVDFQEGDDEILAYLHEIGVTFPSAVDRTGETARQWRATGLPTTFLIDRDGVIRDVRVGAFTNEMLADRLASLLAQ